MAESDKIRSKDIIQEDIFDNTIKSAEDLIKTLDAVEKEFLKVAEAQAQVGKQTAKNIKTADDLKKVTESINVSAEARKRANKIQEEKIKLDEKLKIARSTAIDQNEELKVLISEQTKINKEFAKDKLGLIGAYEKESKRLIKLRKEYKDLAIEGKENTKRFKQLGEEIRTLDKRLKDVDASAGQFQRNVGNYPEALKDAGKGLTDFVKKLAATKLSIDGINEAIQANGESAGAFAEIVGALGGGFSVLANAVGGFFSDLIAGRFDELTANFEDIGNKILKGADAGREAAKSSREFAKELRPLREELTELNAEIEKQNALAGDTTRSFDEQEAAAKKAQKAVIERALILELIAQKELDIIDKQIEARGEGANVEDLLNERTEKAIELAEAKNELDLASLENEKLLREVRRDRFERELDFAIDAFDAQKTVNERQIADDRKTIEERQAILDETIRLTNKSFESQKQLFEEYVSDKIDFDALVAETDEEAIRRTIRQLDLDDVELGRALEVIRERKIALQDLDDAERDLADARAERAAEEAQRQQEALDKLNEALFKEEADRIKRQQDAIDSERAIQDARIDTLKSVNEVAKVIAGEDEDAQRAVLIAKKAIATSEILINLQREISDIRANNAEKDNASALNAAQIGAATAAALAGIVTINAQGSFFDGTEDTGAGGGVDDRGGFYAILHPHERVMTANQNIKTGDLSNDELANIAMMYNKGQLVNPFTDMAINVINKDKVKDNTHLLINEISKLRKDINAKPVQMVNVDSLGNLVEVIYRNGIKETIKHKRNWL